jgi:acetoin utilization deacetylase AcuC-like enzyme
MPLPPVVWSDAHRLHEPNGEIWVGVRTPGTELPARAEAIRVTLAHAGAQFVPAEPHEDEHLLAVHDAALVEFLRTAWQDWVAAGLPVDPGQDRVVPYVFPHRGLIDGVAPIVPAAPWARPGAFCFDTMTLVGPGTWDAARAAVDCALTACAIAWDGGSAAYACCRPPGHHVTANAYGGSCYLNNAAVAAQRLRGLGAARVALIDIDAHHGNGAQAIFWARRDVFTASVHVDPAAGWFPHYLGLASERGARAGEGANLNIPLPPGSGDGDWLAAVDALVAAARRHGSEALVVALGVDAAAGDPESPLRESEDGYRQAGRLLSGLGVPTVLVQEGGYDLTTIGALVLATLEGFSS